MPKGIPRKYKAKDGCHATIEGIQLHFKKCTECPFPRCREEVPFSVFTEWLDLYIHGRMNSGKKS